MTVSKQIERSIFESALELTEPARRAAFLDEACNGQPELRRRLERLLAAEASSAEFFREIPVLEAAPNPPSLPAASLRWAARGEAPDRETTNTVIGRYRLFQRLGEGGCGVVYLAEQLEPVRRRVALKIIRLGMDTESVIARFDAERQALALMDHPNIAHVLDAGATEAGRPYFVMELVDGIKITDYCNQNNLDMPQRLNLFIQVCHAVQHAHQKGVIHRDIKPSNILIAIHNGKPMPKVIDFGIAKAVEGRLTDNTLYTASDQFIGTPAYMSPEQAEMSGVDVDTRSDIYSLGVLLYELLTGQTPFDSKDLVKGGVDEMRRTLREEEPQPPSTLLTNLGNTKLHAVAVLHHAEPLRLISTVRGDLDWIVMKALEKDRGRRYETANGLALDVQRYLSNEPVLARPPNRFYRLQKLVRRNIGVFLAVGAVALSLIGGISVSTWLFFRERAARLEQVRMHKAEESRQKLSLAMIQFSQGRLEEADRLVDGVVASEVTYPYAPMFRAMGGWNAGLGRWKRACDQMAMVVQITDPRLWERTLDYLRYGPLLIESGDVTGYEGFRLWAISQCDGTTDPELAERVVKACVILPATKELLVKLEPLAAVAEKSFESLHEPFDHLTFAWRAFSLGLMKYRQGDYAGSEAMCRRALSYDSRNDVTIASVNLVLAMNHLRLGQKDQARIELEGARATIENHKIMIENGVDVVWFDWVFARILLREATALFDNTKS
jgi:hypothetical protein